MTPRRLARLAMARIRGRERSVHYAGTAGHAPLALFVEAIGPAMTEMLVDLGALERQPDGSLVRAPDISGDEIGPPP